MSVSAVGNRTCAVETSGDLSCWGANDYRDWSARLLREGAAFVTPTTVAGEVVTRIAIVNPRTTRADVAAILDTMA